MRWFSARTFRRNIEIDLATNEKVFTLESDGGDLGGPIMARIEEIDLDLGVSFLKRFRIAEADPLSAQATARSRRGTGRWRSRACWSEPPICHRRR